MFGETFIIIFFIFQISGSPRNGRIVNGTDAKEGEIPYIVSFRENNYHKCGGSILDETHILTAAHCIQWLSDSDFSIQYGLTEISSGANAKNVISYTSAILHDGYDQWDAYKNDIAIVELESPLVFGPDVQPVKLPPPFNATPANAPALLSGWGYPDSNHEILMTHLQKVDLMVYSDDDCERIHAQTGPTNRFYHICAGVPQGGKGQCTHDSGGPLIVDGFLVGIVSWSVKPCAVKGYPGVFTKVSTYVDWIFDHIGSH